MKKLHSIALFTLLTPIITLSSTLALAQQTAGQDIDQEQQRSQQRQGAAQSTTGTPQSTHQSSTGASQSEQHSQRAQHSQAQSATDRQNATGQSRMENRGFMNAAPANSMHASNLIGADVMNYSDDDVGSVSDLIIDHEGQVVAIIVGVGGFLGMGQRDVAIGWDDVTMSHSNDDHDLRINSTRDDLSSAPEFRVQTSQGQRGALQSTPRASQTATGSQQTASGDPHSTAGTQHSTIGSSQSTAGTPRSTTGSAQSTAGTAGSSQSATGGSQSDQGTMRPQHSQGQTVAGGQSSRGHMRMEHRGFMDSAPSNGMHASHIMGVDVKTANNEDVGPANDLIIDAEGQVVAIIVGVGGFLGMGERDVAIGWDDVTRTGAFDDQELRVSVTRESVRSAPEFKKQD